MVQINRLVMVVFVAFFISNALATSMNTFNAPAAQPITVMPITIVPSNEPPDWRDFRSLSAHPNGEDIFFVECYKKPAEDCRVLRFNLKTRALTYYDLPKGYMYLSAYLSPSGKKLALVRVPQEVKSFPENLERYQIAVMNSDGTNFEVLPLAQGVKNRPTFNASDDRLAFWRGEPRTQPAKTSVTDIDVYEYDFKTGKEYPFGPSYRFFQAGEIYYLPSGDELLVNTDIPLQEQARLGLDTHAFGIRYPNHIFHLRRGQTGWTAPLFANESFKAASRLALSRDGAMVFKAEAKKEGTSIFRSERAGGFTQWSYGFADNSIRHLFGAATANYSVLMGNQLIGIFNKHDAQRERDLKRFLILDMQTGEWRTLHIPSLSTAKPIPVTTR